MELLSELESRAPKGLQERLRAELSADERVVSFFLTDLDGKLAFSEGLAVLTDRRLLVLTDEGAKSLPLSSIASLTATDRGGLGVLEALGANELLGRWHYTVGRARGAIALAERFAELRSGSKGSSRPQEDEEVPEAETHAGRPKAGTLFRLLRFARGHVALLSLGIVLTLGSTAAGLVPPYLTWPLVDDVLSPYQEQVKEVREDLSIAPAEKTAKLEQLKAERGKPFGKVPWYLLGMLGAALLSWGLGWAQGWVLARLSEYISADLRNTTYAHLQRMSLEYFSAKRTGDLVSRISSDTDRICMFLSDTLTDFATDVLMIAGTAVMLFYMDPWMAIATLVTFPATALLTSALRSKLSQGFLHGYRAWGEMTAILADTIPGVRVVKAFAQEQREVQRFREANDRIVEANNRVNRLWTFFWPMVALLNQFGLLVAWALGAWRVYDQQITVGVLTAFLAYIARFYARLESMTRMAGNLEKAAASSQRIFEILDRAPSVPEPAHPVSPGKVSGDIEVKNVSFRFGNRQVLDNVSLKIQPGEMIGLVGPTGSGKSTLLNLVCRFYDVGEGAVCVDGKDVRSFPVSEYRKNIGIVLQDPFLFFGTIADNIAYGKPEATREEIIAAAKAARAHEFILQLPEGYDSIVGERGQTLSGGERQRISIARALLIDPRILILDEATSSVDTQTERQIQEALDHLIKGRTTIAIAHRLSTLRDANRLVVLERGKIVEVGSHEQLIASGGLYKKLYEAQSQAATEVAA